MRLVWVQPTDLRSQPPSATSRDRAGADVAAVTLGRRRNGVRRMTHKLNAAPLPVRIIAIAITVVVLLTFINLGYHMVRKPTELFSLVGGELNKAPAETWRQYGPLFREYSTAAVTPEVLAALAQVEGAGNPVARTYWRWPLSWNPLALYQPASSGVGMFQMTDAAFAEARGFCIRDHVVVENPCWFTWLYTRMLPSHAIELSAVYLDRNIAGILAGRPKITAKHMQEIAAFSHLCGAAAAKTFAQRGFRTIAGEHCGDHDVASYLARVNAVQQVFIRIAADL